MLSGLFFCAFEVVLSNSVIVAAKGEEPAARELQRHLELMSGAAVPCVKASAVPDGAYAWRVGFVPDGASAPAADSEESTWRTDEGSAWFYGDGIHGAGNAVFSFLEDGLGVRWPFGTNVFCKARTVLHLKPLARTWKPELKIREIRHPDRYPDQGVWAGRMRFGKHDATPGYGHHYTRYWDRFHETHPEFFAMRKDGKRLPYGVEDNPDDIAAAAGSKWTKRIAMCVSCEGLVRQAVEDWIAEGKPPYINVCENDAGAPHVCWCPNCQALDAVPAVTMKPPIKCLADRYVHYTNCVLEEAKKHRPDVRAWFYAYNAAEDPPRRERPADDAIAGFVPTTFLFPAIEDYFRGWQRAGLKHFFYRPNRHWYYRLRYLPLGCEKYFFRIWRTAYDCGAIGFDYDSPGKYGDLEWFRDYVIAKAMQDPSKDFEHWERHYMQAFGAAADDVRNYFRHWREEVWEKRIEPKMAAVCARARNGSFDRGLMADLVRYYREDDFAVSGAFLEAGLRRADLSDFARPLVERLVLAHEHATLVFRAVRDKGRNARSAQVLFEFRRAHGFRMLPWEENGFDDACGLRALATAAGYKEEPQWIP